MNEKMDKKVNIIIISVFLVMMGLVLTIMVDMLCNFCISDPDPKVEKNYNVESLTPMEYILPDTDSVIIDNGDIFCYDEFYDEYTKDACNEPEPVNWHLVLLNETKESLLNGMSNILFADGSMSNSDIEKLRAKQEKDNDSIRRILEVVEKEIKLYEQEAY